MIASVVVAGVAVLGYRLVDSVRTQALDRPAREALALELLGAATMPAGYTGAVALSLPVFGQLVVLEAAGARPPGVPSRKSLIYLKRRPTERRLPFGVYGAERFDMMLELRGLELEGNEPLDSGRDRVGEQELDWTVERARIADFPAAFAQVLLAKIEVRCDEFRKRDRLVVWVAPDPAGAPGQMTPRPGESPADRRAIRELFAGFALCGR